MSINDIEVRVSKYILQAKNIHKNFITASQKIDVLKGVSLNIEKGKSVAIQGSSGEGKTTLLHVIGTLESFSSGSLTIAGKQVTKNNAAHIRNILLSFIFQNYNLLEDFSLIDNILMPARISRSNINKQSFLYKKAHELLDSVGLSKRAQFPVKLLSGGEKQRAAIARSLCNDPELILADEPSGNLDHSNSRIIHNLLIDSVKATGKSLLVVTHDKELAALCDHVYILEDGVLLDS